MKIPKLIIAASVLAAVISGPAIAQEKPIKLHGDVMLEKSVEGPDGVTKTMLVEPKLIVPGDRLIFGTDYENTSAEAVTDFVVTNPLPAAVKLASDADASLVVSVDGGKNWGKLPALTVSDENGSKRSATHADVTHVRWTLAKVAPGEDGRLEFPVIIR